MSFDQTLGKIQHLLDTYNLRPLIGSSEVDERTPTSSFQLIFVPVVMIILLNNNFPTDANRPIFLLRSENTPRKLFLVLKSALPFFLFDNVV